MQKLAQNVAYKRRQL